MNAIRGLALHARVVLLFLCALFASLPALSTANAETRSLKIYHIHTGERVEIVFKRNGRYVQDGLNKLNYALRDWRRNEPTKMDPRLFDTIWQAYQKSGANGYINVVGGYRSAATNSMLRKRSKGVAEKSQHIRGKAMDFFIPGVSLKKLRYIGLQIQAGGVGYYPRSGSPFVHMDVGSVRHWPRMSRSELMAVFPNGNTIHTPSDGRPLAGYNVALASYKSRLQNASSAKFDNSSSGDGGSSKPRRSLLAALFGGGGADDEEDTNDTAGVAVAANAPAKETQAVAAAVGRKRLPLKETEKEVIVAALPQRTSPAPLAVIRPQKGLDEAAPVETEALAFAVPVPARKPRLNPVLAEPTAEAALAARMSPETSAELIAVSAEAGDAQTIRAALGAEAPAAEQTAAQEDFLEGPVPVPGRKPDQNDSYMVASIAVPGVAVPSPRPAYKSASMTAAPAEAPVLQASLAAGGAAQDETDLRKLLAGDNGIDPATVADTGVKTTDKAAKPQARDAKKARRPVSVPVTQDIGKFALTKEPVTNNGADVQAVAYENTVWEAPTEVYVAGFSTEAPQDVNKFSGKAVNFLKVAKFKKAK